MMLEEPLTSVTYAPTPAQADSNHHHQSDPSGLGGQDTYRWADPVGMSWRKSTSIGRMRERIHA